MSKSVKFGLALLVILVIFGIVSWSLAGSGVGPESTNPQTPNQTQVTPSEAPISTQVPVQIATFRGSVTVVNSGSITIKTVSDSKSFSLVQTRDVQKVSSGTLEGGNVQTAKAALSDVAVGQEVLVVSDKAGTNAISILIIK